MQLIYIQQFRENKQRFVGLRTGAIWLSVLTLFDTGICHCPLTPTEDVKQKL